MRQPSWWALVGVGTALVGGLGWAVAQGPADAPALPKLDITPVLVLPAPPPAKPAKALSREATSALQQFRENARKLSAAVAAFDAERPKWVAKRDVQAVAVRAEVAAVQTAEAELAAAEKAPSVPALPGLDLPAGNPPAITRIGAPDVLTAKAKLAATVAARDRQQKLLDQIGQRLAHMDAAVAACEKQKVVVREQMARVYFDELDEDGKGYSMAPHPMPGVELAPPTGEAWTDHTRPWPPVGPAKSG